MPQAAICILAVSAIFWVLVSYFRGGNNNVSKKVNVRPSGIGTGWIWVIVFVVMAMMFLNNNAQQIQNFIDDQADGIVILLIIFLFLFMFYLRGIF